MSVAATQYDKFKEQVVAEGRVFTFTDHGELLVYPIPIEGGETVPFWSSRSRLATIQQRLAKYRQFEITELSFTEFWQRLQHLDRENVKVGVNWSGSRLTGYNVTACELREGLSYWLGKLGRQHLLDTVS